jgi:hypothetical protein
MKTEEVFIINLPREPSSGHHLKEGRRGAKLISINGRLHH